MKKKESKQVGVLAKDEAHPAAFLAGGWLRTLGRETLNRWLIAFSSVAITGDRPAEICAETLRRVLAAEPVSDRYLLGLAWMLRSSEDLSAEVDKQLEAESLKSAAPKKPAKKNQRKVKVRR